MNAVPTERDRLRAFLQTAPRDQVRAALADWSPDEQADALRCRFAVDFLWWAAHCYPHLVYRPFNRVHRWIATHLATLPPFEARAGQSAEQCFALEAPRGIAKTTMLKLFILWSLTHHRERGVVWCGGVQSDAKKETRHLRAELERPPAPYVALYGTPRVWGEVFGWFVQFDGHPRVQVSTRGIPGQRLRGLNDNGQRPTLVIGDDIEHPEAVRNPARRNDLTDFVNSDLRNVGPPEGGLVWIQSGTRLHADSQTARAAADPAYRSRRFQAILSWPTAAALWARCRELWADLTDPDREETARGFYDRHRAAMDAGARVLDPVGKPLYTLMTTLWSVGWSSFMKDFQNDPTDPSRQLFFPDRWRRCQLEGGTILTSRGRRVALSSCRLAAWLDPRASKQAERNDYAAAAVVAREAGTGARYLLTASLRRTTAPLRQIDLLWAIYDRFGPTARYGYEDNGFADMLGDDVLTRSREARRAAGKPDGMRLVGYTSTANKIDRISSLEPALDNGFMEVSTDIPGEVIEQFRQFPTASHDDGPDAVERADWLAGSAGAGHADLHAQLRGR